ncbi:MAG: hypothetical protein WC208_16475 [Gallionella sp.]|jgi:hypothetical protein
MSQLQNASTKADGQDNEIAASQCPDLSLMARQILKRLISQGE